MVSFNSKPKENIYSKIKSKVRKKAIESLKRLRTEGIIFEIELRKRGIIK